MPVPSCLPPDEYDFFHCPCEPNMVRMGTVPDGSCFFHSLLSCHFWSGGAPEDASSLPSVSERCEKVRQYREELADRFTPSVWSSLLEHNVEFAHYLLQSYLLDVLFCGEKEGTTNSSKSRLMVRGNGTLVPEPSSAAQKLWEVCITKDWVESVLLPRCSSIDLFSAFQDHFVSMTTECCVSYISSSRLGKTMTKDEEQRLMEILTQQASKVLEAVWSTLYTYFQSQIRHATEWVDLETLYCLSPMLKHDLIIVHAETRSLYFDTRQVRPLQDHPHHCLLLLYFPQGHFEALGRWEMSWDGKPTIVFRFRPTDPVVRQFRQSPPPLVTESEEEENKEPPQETES